MGMDWTVFGWRLAAVALGLALFGTGYNLLVARFQRRTTRYTAEFVAGGVLVTVLASGLVIGWEAALAVLVCFGASGLPMLAGSWLRNAADDEAARRAGAEWLEEFDDGE